MRFNSCPRHAAWRFLGLLGLTCAALVPLGASAQADYPSKPVRIVISFPVGGLSDSLARLYGMGLSDRFDQPFLIESKPGAAYLATAPPDDYTLYLMVAANSFPSAVQRIKLVLNTKKY